MLLNIAIFTHQPVASVVNIASFLKFNCVFHSSVMSSKKKQKSLCPFASAKETFKGKKAKTLKRWGRSAGGKRQRVVF